MVAPVSPNHTRVPGGLEDILMIGGGSKVGDALRPKPNTGKLFAPHFQQLQHEFLSEPMRQQRMRFVQYDISNAAARTRLSLEVLRALRMSFPNATRKIGMR